MTGLHHMTNAIDITLTTKFGGTILWPMIALSNIAQGSSVLAMSVLQRHNKRAEQVNVPACISAYLGVTEPALFGVNLKYGFPLVCGMIGSAVAAIISVGSGVQALSIGVGGIPGILSINPQFWGSFALAMAAAIVIPFVLTWLVGQRKVSAAAEGSAPLSEIDPSYKNYLDGQVRTMKMGYYATLMLNKDFSKRICDIYDKASAAWEQCSTMPRNPNNLRNIVTQAGFYGAGARFDDICEI